MRAGVTFLSVVVLRYEPVFLSVGCVDGIWINPWLVVAVGCGDAIWDGFSVVGCGSATCSSCIRKDTTQFEPRSSRAPNALFCNQHH